MSPMGTRRVASPSAYGVGAITTPHPTAALRSPPALLPRRDFPICHHDVRAQNARPFFLLFGLVQTSADGPRLGVHPTSRASAL